MKIGVFDSGIGGLTVLKELIKYPNEYYYFGDNINIPYGNKSIEELRILSSRIVDFLLTKKVDVIIIACGTLSANVYDYLKSKYNIPIYDIISPTLNYLKNKEYYTFATEMTIKSNIFKNGFACPKLVPLIENNLDVTDALKEYLNNIPINSNLVLGCTHYPYLTKDINKLRSDINIINMGKILSDELNLPSNQLKINLYFSKVDSNLKINIDKLISNYNLEEICLNCQK